MPLNELSRHRGYPTRPERQSSILGPPKAPQSASAVSPGEWWTALACASARSTRRATYADAASPTAAPDAVLAETVCVRRLQYDESMRSMYTSYAYENHSRCAAGKEKAGEAPCPPGHAGPAPVSQLYYAVLLRGQALSAYPGHLKPFERLRVSVWLGVPDHLDASVY